MSDDIKQPVPGQGTVQPVEQASGATQSGSPVPQAQEPAGQQGTEGAKIVTAQDLAALREELKREIQSQVDKGESRAVKKAVTEVKASIKTLRETGHEITPKDEEALIARAVQQATIAQATAEEPAAPQPVTDWTDASQWDQNDPITQAVKEAQKEIGLVLTAEMPEAATVVRNKGPRAFLKSYEDALTAAKKRMSTPPAQNNPDQSNNAPARIPPTGSEAQPEKSARDYLQEARTRR